MISKNERLQITKIAENQGITQPGATQFCNSLNKKGLIELTSHVKDQRIKEAKITKKGSELVEKLIPLWEEITYAIKDIIKASEHDLLLAVENFENHQLNKDLKQRVEESLRQKNLSEIKILDYNDKLKEPVKLLNYEWLNKYFEVEPCDEKVLSSPKSEIINKGGYIFYAKFRKKIVGTVVLFKINSNTYEIAKMAVTEKCQGKGIGKKLLEHSLNISGRLGAKKLILYSNTKLAHAINLYFKAGFRVVPMDKAYIKRANIKMEKILGS